VAKYEVMIKVDEETSLLELSFQEVGSPHVATFRMNPIGALNLSNGLLAAATKTLENIMTKHMEGDEWKDVDPA